MCINAIPNTLMFINVWGFDVYFEILIPTEYIIKYKVTLINLLITNVHPKIPFFVKPNNIGAT